MSLKILSQKLNFYYNKLFRLNAFHLAALRIFMDMSGNYYLNFFLIFSSKLSAIPTSVSQSIISPIRYTLHITAVQNNATEPNLNVFICFFLYIKPVLISDKVTYKNIIHRYVAFLTSVAISVCTDFYI